MISVIIPAYNSEKTIARCLQSLLDQEYDGEYEIILVDGSVDRTPEIVRERFPTVRYFRIDGMSDPGAKRNLGIREAKGDPLLFIDSDCVAEPDWMRRMVEQHAVHPDVAAVGGAAYNGNDPGCGVAWAGYMGEFREFIPENPEGYVDHIPTLNISYKRWVFERHGFFESRYFPQEDLIFNYNLRRKGERILFHPGIRVHHTHRTELHSFLAHQRKIGKITSLTLREFPFKGARLVRNRLLFVLVGPIIPVAKSINTLKVFITRNPRILLRYPRAFLIFNIGLIYWFWGFCAGVFARNLPEDWALR